MATGKNEIPVDRGWAWMIVVGYFISVFCMVGIAKSFGILMQEFVDYFDIPVALAASIMGVSGAVYTVSAPICVAGGQHFSQRRVVMLGGVVGALGLCLSSGLFSIQYVICTWGILYGFGNACIFGNGLVMLGQYFVKRRSLANGLALSGASIGQLIIPPLLQLLLDNYKLQGTLLIIGGLYLNVMVCGALYRPVTDYIRPSLNTGNQEEKKLIEDVNNGKVLEMNSISKENGDTLKNDELRDSGNCSDMTKLTGDGDVNSLKQRKVGGEILIGSVDSLHTVVVEIENQSLSKMAQQNGHQDSNQTGCIHFLKGLIDFSVMRSYVVIWFVIVSFLIFFGHFNFIIFMPPAVLSKGIERYDKAYLVSITGVCDLCGRILVGVAGDLNCVARYKLMAVATTLCGLAILGFNFAVNYWAVAVCVGLYGFLGGSYVAINAPVLIDFVGLKHMPKVLGVVLFIQGLGAALGQPALGALRDHLGSYEAINYINMVSMIAGSVLLFLYPLVKKLEDRRVNRQLDQELKL